jgi:hypothetical protein
VKVLKERIADRPLADLASFDLERFKRDREKEGVGTGYDQSRRLAGEAPLHAGD